MNIMSRLTVKCLRLNKRRTLVTMIGIVISAALISGVATFAQSYLNWMIQSEIAVSGNWHVRYNNISAQKLSVFEQDSETSVCSAQKDIGYAFLDGSQNEAKPYVFLTAYSDTAFQNLPIQLTDGRLPQNSHELVITQPIIDNAGVSLSIGQQLTLRLGRRQSEDLLKNGNQKFWPDQTTPFGTYGDETLSDDRTQTYTVVGIAARPNSEPYIAPGYSVFTLLDQQELSAGGDLSVSVALRHVDFSIYDHAETLMQSAGGTSRNIKFHSYLLQYYRLTRYSSVNRTLDLIVLFFIFVIMIGSIALIYNSFSISLAERSRYLGMLSSVGATRRQKRNSVFFEGLLLGVVSIPVGILCGISGIGIALALIRPLLASLSDSNIALQLSVSWLSVVVSFVFSALTILLSALLPAHHASRIPPIDAIRQTSELRLTRRNVRTAGLTRRIFGLEGDLALKNLKRNKGRYRSTIVSLSVSLSLFLTISFFSKQLNLLSGIVSEDSPCDVTISVNSAGPQDFSLLQRASAQDSVEQSQLLDILYARLLLSPEALSAPLRNQTYSFNSAPDGSSKLQVSVALIALQDTAFQEYLSYAGISSDLFDGNSLQAVLVNQSKLFIGEKYVTGKFFLASPLGSAIDFLADDDTQHTVTPLAETTVLPRGISLENGTACYLITSYRMLQKYTAELQPYHQAELRVNTRRDELFVREAQKILKPLDSDRVYIQNYAANMRNERNSRLITCIFIYSFTLLITLICVANVFNTVSTGMALRKREFAMLRSIGMTPKSMTRMVWFESFFYGFKALLYGLPASFLLMLILSRIILNSFLYAFSVPWKSVGIAIISVFLLILLIMLRSASVMKKEAIVDALKQENI